MSISEQTGKAGAAVRQAALWIGLVVAATAGTSQAQSIEDAPESIAREANDDQSPSGEGSPRPGDSFRDCAKCPEMVVVPAGSYRMGSPLYERGRDEDEGPVHEVTISAPFAIGRYEVTVAEFGRFVDGRSAGGLVGAGHQARVPEFWRFVRSEGNSCRIYEDGKWEGRAGKSWPVFGQGGRFPVVCVSWNDAQSYTAWLSRQTGEEYRLPGESEWEYAARAGTSTSRHWGDGETGQCRHANGADASAEERYPDWPWTVASCRDGHVHTAPVGSFEANGWGLHDMLGNVWEWTEDCWDWQYRDCAGRVLRGGSWSSKPSDLRAAYRLWNTTGLRSSIVGFRVARTLAP